MSAAGDVVASGADDKTVRFWDLARPADDRDGDGSGGHACGGWGEDGLGGSGRDAGGLAGVARRAEGGDDGSASVDTAGGGWEPRAEPRVGAWGGGLQGGGVWSGVGGVLEVAPQRLLLAHSVLSLACDSNGRAVVATDLKGGVFCSVLVSYTSTRR